MLGLKLNHVSKRGYCRLSDDQLQALEDLTHLPLDKMAAILSDDIFKCIFLNENDRITIQNSLQFVPDGPIDNNLALVLDNGLAPARRQGIIWTNDG